ncbi:sulfotransferase family 2 domain-containing protein [Nereida ignava]|uniref:Sulfotransferase family protein n=1 Tax=Nereida ignava TaxID=282199 RepID=A0A0U1NME0_9RHOB|nr:sulfotransferase family 2 domain-containing protein [Nereida ignava]CRK75877.1 hypothetical protein NIG5292_01933 [Nereida ignava]SFJ76888.1 Sulfotransferase family protein [Nereida ignava DSM 16309]
MIYSKGRNYLLTHAPKTGGTALMLALEARAMADDIIVGDTPKGKARAKRQKSLQTAGRLWKHATRADLAGLVDGAPFAVSLVRNPWDRVVSYYHWLRAQQFTHRAVALAKDETFETFVLTPWLQDSLRAHPYAHYVTDETGVEQCDAFIRLEHLTDDLAPFEAHLGFKLEVGRANASQRDADYRGYFSNTTRDVIADVCAQDIARFGYVF